MSTSHILLFCCEQVSIPKVCAVLMQLQVWCYWAAPALACGLWVPLCLLFVFLLPLRHFLSGTTLSSGGVFATECIAMRTLTSKHGIEYGKPEE